MGNVYRNSFLLRGYASRYTGGDTQAFLKFIHKRRSMHLDLDDNPHELHLHLISDSTGETVSSVARSVMSQFEHVDAIEHIWALVRTEKQMDRIIEAIHFNPGVVIFTIVEQELKNKLVDACRNLGVPCIPMLDRVMREISSYLGVEVKVMPGRQHELDEDYFERVDVLNFALTHDDGQQVEELHQADVVLVGVSRTSKSPTCISLPIEG